MAYIVYFLLVMAALPVVQILSKRLHLSTEAQIFAFFVAGCVVFGAFNLMEGVKLGIVGGSVSVAMAVLIYDRIFADRF